MKSKIIGTIRHVDYLGRIVLPKDIRNELNIVDGDPLSIGINGNTILLEKYQKLQNLDSLFDLYLRAFSSVGNIPCAICSIDFVLISRNISLSSEIPISHAIREYIRHHDHYLYNTDVPLYLFDTNKYPVMALFPIGCDACSAGALLLFGSKNITEKQIACAEMLASIITNLIEKTS